MQVYPNDEEMELDILTGNFAPKKCPVCNIQYTEDECPECERVGKIIDEDKDDIYLVKSWSKCGKMKKRRTKYKIYFSTNLNDVLYMTISSYSRERAVDVIKKIFPSAFDFR